MIIRRQTMKKAHIVLAILTSLVLMAVPAAAAYAEGLSGSATDSDITATITLDKDSYLAGETITYSVTIENNRYGYYVAKGSFNYNNTDSLISADGKDLDTAYTKVAYGDTFELTGQLIGDASVFPADESLKDSAQSDGSTTAGTGTVSSDNGTAEGSAGSSSTSDARTSDSDADDSSNHSSMIVIGLCFLAALMSAMTVRLRKRGSSEAGESSSDGKKDMAGKSNEDDKNGKNGKSGKNGKNGTGTMAMLLVFALCVGLFAGVYAEAPSEAYAADYEEVNLRPYIKFTYGGQEVMVRVVMSLHVYQDRIKIATNNADNPATTSCHDPSIFKDFDGTYYIFGTHMGLSRSTDLHDWTNMDSEFRATFDTDTIAKIREWNDDGSSGSWYSYLWAPDVVYNEKLGKYCMYLSADGDNWISNIVLLTADVVTGPYSYVGTVVYGGFTDETYSLTDVAAATGEETIADRYVTYGVKNKKWGDMYPNCIDPCVFYDDDGNLWMSYGSWSGGIFMLALDEETGLRDYSVTYETGTHTDAYFGKLIAGGKYVSGEASYIQKIEDYYYLFISYGGLNAAEGYNIRTFRSENPDGPYYDTYVQNYNANIGIRLFGAYKWRTMAYGLVSQGHNSAFVDDDGKAYIVFHTRTTDGTEGHYVRVHQLFVNKEGWLVAAPYITNGETLNEEGYSVSEVAGDYELIIHNLGVDYANLETNKTVLIHLNEDGTITGAYDGTWSLESGTPYITLEFNNETYSGVELMMKVDNSKIETMVFTALGETNQITIWGSKVFEQ